MNKNSGAGFIDFIKDPVGTIKESFAGVPTRLNNISTRTLQSVGDIPIIKIDVAKTPIPSAIEGAINTISFGSWNKLKSKYGHKTLYHLSLIFVLRDGQKVILEKNEVIDIRPLQNSNSINKNTQYLSVPHSGNLTLNEIINKTQKAIGNKAMFDYQGMRNNCQNFILNILKFGCNINIPWVNEWIYQDFTKIREELPSHVEPIMDKVTGLASIGSRLMAKGKKKPTKKETQELEKYMKEKNITKEDIMIMLNRPDFLEMIKNNEFKFI